MKKEGFIKNYNNCRILYYGGDFVATNKQGGTIGQAATITEIKSKINNYNKEHFLTYEEFTKKFKFYKFKKCKYDELNGVCYWLDEPLTQEQKEELKKYHNVKRMVGIAQYASEKFIDCIWIENKTTKAYNTAKERAREKERAQQKQNNFETLLTFGGILFGVAIQFIILIIILSKY